MSSSHIMSGLMITWRRREMRYIGLIFHMSNTLFQPFDVVGVWCKVYLRRSGILFTIDVPFTLQPEIISLHPMVFFSSHPRERGLLQSSDHESGFLTFFFLICCWFYHDLVYIFLFCIFQKMQTKFHCSKCVNLLIEYWIHAFISN